MVNKERILKAKDTEANLKLNQMVEKQNEAEHQKTIAEKLTIELQKQNEEIRVRKESVEKELSEAEPALLSAKHSVQNIKKAQLDELRALTRPPQAVMVTMEMVSVMIGEKSTDWNEIRKVIRRDDFISTVVNFDPSALTSKQVKQVQDDYLSNSDIDYNSVDRASKACGPLYQWAESQIKYATILRRIKPLRDEVLSLQEQSEQLQAQQQEAVAQVETLENAIKTYKAEYAAAIRETEKIQTEMDLVSKKVNRAEALLQSLDIEKDRWQATSSSFDLQMGTLIGDCLLAAAFLTYGGIFDHKLRRSLMLQWMETLEALNIPYRADLNMIAYLSSPAEQMRWKGQGLMPDDLAIENAILLERFDRYPLVVDPSGQATQFLMSKYASQKISMTSFLDASFLKNLASAIRFGTPLLVNDVESVDPILNPILNKELQKTGGRILIRLGSEDIDFSPKFFIILTTRNPSARFAPDLCSRVTLVNFTVTPASLEAQTLSAVLKAERPDVDYRRTEILRLQGEQSVKLRELEESLLNQISAVQGAILDDDSVIKALEQIKSEAADLMREVSKTEEIMAQVKVISSLYEPLAITLSSVYFAMEALADVHFLYQFSLQLFLEMTSKVLKTASSSSLTTQPSTVLSSAADSKLIQTRVRQLTYAFMSEVSRRLLRSLHGEDKLMFLVRLGQIATNGQPRKGLSAVESDVLYKGALSYLSPADLDTAASAVSTKVQRFKELFPGRIVDDMVARQLCGLSLVSTIAPLLPQLASLSSDVVTLLLDGPLPEQALPNTLISAVDKDADEERILLLKTILIRALRPERTVPALEDYSTAVFQSHFDWREHSLPDLKKVVDADSKAARPIMICSEPGQDASSKVDTLATACQKTLLQVAMGSAEGFVDADKSIAQALKQGYWVLLRNVHLCNEWLSLLGKRLSSFTPHPDFRLFLTAEIHPGLPSALLRASDVVVAEASTGVKANMSRFYNSIPVSRIDKQPVERVRLYGLLAWLNAVILERKRYAPLGWTKKYEWNEADALCSLDVIDEWLDGMSAGDGGKLRAHVDPESIPWEALRTLLSESLYGGRVDDPFDQVLC